MPSSWVGLTAQRFEGKPLRQPKYTFRDTPRCLKDLKHSSLYEISNRDHWNDSMAEMVLLCNEVMRRKRLQQQQQQQQQQNNKDKDKDNNESKATATVAAGLPSPKTKPLSLEYMADRLDVDDPLFGFMIRTNSCPPPTSSSSSSPFSPEHSRFQQGMLQGFITITTFTNWQKSFMWDSLHGSAFSYDEPPLAEAMVAHQRKWDSDGSLAMKLQRTVRCGDPYNEGIVWPRIAEISLLGALGCGKALLSLAIERLEGMVASGKQNYDYVVLQATDNSVPFYESMGFVRVGCVTQDLDRKDSDGSSGNDVATTTTVTTTTTATTVSAKKSNKPPQPEIVSSPVFTVNVKKNGETVMDYAKKYDVDAWDIVFLTQFLYPDLEPRSYLMKGTTLYIPDKTKTNNIEKNAVQWYSCLDNETPREIAKKFNVTCKDLLTANRGRIEHLLAHSRLIEGTKVQVSNLDEPVSDHYVPYCHWTFPDDKFENNEPSYMMVRKLNRKNRVQAKKCKPVEESFAVKVSEYIPEKIPAVANATVIAPPKQQPLKPFGNTNMNASTKAKKKSNKKKKKKSKKRKRDALPPHPDQPLEPKKPRTAYMTFLHHEIERLKNKNLPVSLPEMSRITSQRWKNMTEESKEPFMKEATEAKKKYDENMKQYRKEWKEFEATHQEWIKAQEKEEEDSDDDGHDDGGGGGGEYAPSRRPAFKNLVNKVVKLNKEGQQQVGTEFQYYFVLTYIPDLFWCHLAPMRKVGIHTKKKAAGRTKWMLVDEGEGKEIDITGAVCEIVKSRVMKGCEDADKEEWDIIDPEVEPKIIKSKVTSKKPGIPSLPPPHQNNAVGRYPIGMKEPKHAALIPPSSESSPQAKAATGSSDVVRRYPVGMKVPKHESSVSCTEGIPRTMSDSTVQTFPSTSIVMKAVTESDMSDRASDWDLSVSDADPLCTKKVHGNLAMDVSDIGIISDSVITPLVIDDTGPIFEGVRNDFLNDDSTSSNDNNNTMDLTSFFS